MVWSRTSKPSRAQLCGLILGALAFAPLSAVPQMSESVQPSPDSANHSLTIPDGTPVELRFAQPVRGKMMDPVDVGTEARPGDTVRLVAAAGVRVNDLIVIAEGAIAQATVTRVKRPLTSLNATGLALQLDWIEDVTGARIPLRVLPKGEREPFMPKVISTSAGVVARPETLHSDLAGKDAIDFPEIWRSRQYVPAGTRIMTYVHGSPVLSRAKVEQAQLQVSLFQGESTADVTIYRTKGRDGDRPRILCDGRLGAQIGERQYIHLDLPPGKHSCQIESQKPQEISVQMGQEYFFRLRRAGSGWEIKEVTIGEGEDSIENADPAPRQ